MRPTPTFPFLFLRLLAVACLFAGSLFAADWRSSLYPESWQPPGPSSAFYTASFIQDFSFAGYRRGEAPIPDIAGPVFDAVVGYGADPAGVADSTVAIQNALNAAGLAGGGVVFLPAGTYRIAPQGTSSSALTLSRPGVVLRGAGPGQTFLLNTSYEMRAKNVIRIAPASSVTEGEAVAITADLPGPTRRIPVADAAAFAPGDFVRIEWSFTTQWIAEHGQQAYWTAAAGPDPSRVLREVVATHPGEGWIEVDIPTRYSIKTRDAAVVRRVTGLLSEVGVEALSLGNVQHPGTSGWGEEDYGDETKSAYDVHSSQLIRMQDVRDSWIRSVHSFQPAGNTSTAHLLSNGIALLRTSRVTVRDCQIRRPQYGGGGGNGYLYHAQSANENLFADNVAEFSRHGFMVSRASAVGNVLHRCEDRETGRATGATGSYTTSGSSSDNHMHFSHSNLWDLCVGHNSWWSAAHRLFNGTIPHGLAAAKSVYWNTTGTGTRGGAIVASQQARYGYIIGTQGARNTVSTSTTGNTAPADIVQGVGQGASLQPQSLYLDQLARRLRPAVFYNVNSATSGQVPVDTLNPYAPGATVTVLGPGTLARAGHDFVAWNTTQAGTGQSYAPGATFTIGGPVQLHAQWRPRSYTVGFDTTGGTPAQPASISVTFGAPYGPLPAPTRANFSFNGWFTAPADGERITAESLLTLAADSTLYARWSPAAIVDAGSRRYAPRDSTLLWSPAYIATAAWFDAADAVTLLPASGAVAQWLDKSGNDNHLAQSTAARRPVAGTRTLGNLNVVAFDADQDHFMDAAHSESLNFDARGGLSTFSLFRSPGYNEQTGTFNAVFGKGSPFSTTPGFGLQFNPSFNFTHKFSDGGTRSLTLGSAYHNTPLLFSTTGNHATGAQAFFLQGGALSITNTATPTPRLSDNLGDFRVGGAAPTYPGSASWGTTTRYASIDLAELILVPGALATADRQRIEGYLAHKWSLATGLPVAHPHRAAAPTQPVGIVALSGAASSPENKPLTYAWSVVSGPAPVVLADATALATQATFSTAGTYTLRLTARDDIGQASDDLTIVVGDATNRYINYHANGATSGDVPLDPANPYAASATVTVLPPGNLAKAGHVFTGWNTAAAGTGQAYAPGATFTIGGPVLLYAQWAIPSFTVAFDPAGGALAEPLSKVVALGSPYGPLPVPTRIGHRFVGWFTAPGGGELVTATSTLAIAADSTLHAGWSPAPLVHAGSDLSASLATFVPWTPAQLPLAAWFDASEASTVQLGEGGVSAWLDKSPRANHASQLNAALRPAFVEASLGGLPTVSFRLGDGTNKPFLAAPNSPSLNLDAAGGAQLFAVFRYLGFVNNGSTGLNVPLAKGSVLLAEATYGIRIGSNNALSYKAGTTMMPAATGSFIGQDLLFTGTTDRSTRTGSIFLNGSLRNSATQSGEILGDNTSPLYIGRDLDTTRYAEADFGEILLLGGPLAPAERQRIEGYLAHKWSLAANLPPEHPHRASAPGSFAATVTLSGGATSPDSRPLTYAWSLVSGPAAVLFDDATALSPTATFPVEGVYTLRLTVGDDLGQSTDDVVVTIGAASPPHPFVTWFGDIDEQDAPLAFAADANADGVPDGLAWLLGASTPETSARALLPTLAVSSGAYEFSFNLLPPSARGNVLVNLQHSTDLATWETIAVPDLGGTRGGIDFTITPGSGFNGVRGFAPASLAGPGGRIFIRLQAVFTPP